jgi:ABC-2 type transport system ATP-binding protein
MESILKVDNINKQFAGFTLNNVNFEVFPNDIIGFIGENGAGKTTTINLILNFIKKDSGKVFFHGNEFTYSKTKDKKEIGVLKEWGPLYEDCTGEDLYLLTKKSYAIKWDDTFFNYMINDIYKLEIHKKIKDFSTGMLVQFYSALCMAHSPSLLIMDEPTSGLDPLKRDEFLYQIEKYVKENNAALFYSTHIMSDIQKIANRLIFIDKGELKLDINKDDLSDFKCIPLEELEGISTYCDSYKVKDNTAICHLRNKDVPASSYSDASLEDILLLIKG